MKPIDDAFKDKEATTFVDAATIAQLLKAVIRRGKNWETLGADGKEALEQVMTLVARILTGNASDVQHWTGAAAYLQLGARSDGVEGGMERIARQLKTIPNPPEGGA
jgi:hypothetical protein